MSVSRRPNGMWRARHRVPGGKEEARHFRTRAEAEVWDEEQKRRVRRGEWLDPAASRITIGELWPMWLDSRSIKPKTRADYESLWATCVAPTWECTRIDQVAPMAVQTWVSGLVSQGGRPLSASRRIQAHGLLAKILDAAVNDGRVLRNPARAGVTSGRGGYLPRINRNQRRRYLTHAEVERLAEVAGDSGDLILTLAYCGLRWGEAAALHVGDVDLMRGRLHIQGSVAEVHGALVYGSTKTHQTREVVIPAFLRDRLMARVAGKGQDALVFTTSGGAPLRLPNFTRRVFRKALDAAGIEPMKIHDLRHTAAGLAIDSGANVKGVQRMLGHKDASMTLNTYADLFDGHLDAVADRLDAARSEALADRTRTGPGDLVSFRGVEAS